MISVKATLKSIDLLDSVVVVASVRVDLVSGIAETLKKEILLYPNPMANIVHLELPSATKNLQYCLFDSQGKLLAYGILKREELDMSQWSEGT